MVSARIVMRVGPEFDVEQSNVDGKADSTAVRHAVQPLSPKLHTYIQVLKLPEMLRARCVSVVPLKVRAQTVRLEKIVTGQFCPKHAAANAEQLSFRANLPYYLVYLLGHFCRCQEHAWCIKTSRLDCHVLSPLNFTLHAYKPYLLTLNAGH